MTEVLLADHRLLVQYGLQALLQDLPDLTLVDAVGDCGQLARLCRQLKPAVVLLNINLPELQLDQLLIQLASDATATSLLLLLDPGQEAQIDLHKLLQQGGVGAILSDEPNELLFDALRTMGQGKIWFSPRLLFMLIKKERKPSAQPKSLTPQELVVLRQVANGLTNKAIAHTLAITESTVEFHLSNIFQKLHASSRLEAALWFKVQKFPADQTERE